MKKRFRNKYYTKNQKMESNDILFNGMFLNAKFALKSFI